jgi:hypothetical protein
MYSYSLNSPEKFATNQTPKCQTYAFQSAYDNQYNTQFCNKAQGMYASPDRVAYSLPGYLPKMAYGQKRFRGANLTMKAVFNGASLMNDSNMPLTVTFLIPVQGRSADIVEATIAAGSDTLVFDSDSNTVPGVSVTQPANFYIPNSYVENKPPTCRFYVSQPFTLSDGGNITFTLQNANQRPDYTHCRY